MRAGTEIYAQALLALAEIERLGDLMAKEMVSKENHSKQESVWQLEVSDALRCMLGLPYGDEGDPVRIERCDRACREIRVTREGDDRDPWKRHDCDDRDERGSP